MTAITSILTSAEQSIAVLTGYKVRLRMTRVKDAMWRLERERDIDTVLMAVEVAYGIDTDTLMSRSRIRAVSDAKKLACMLMKEYIPRITLKAIAKGVGLRNHATALFHLRTGKGLLQTDGAFIAKHREAKNMLEGLKTL